MIYIGSDHAGFELKQAIYRYLYNNQYDIIDIGCYSNEAVDYPDFAKTLCERMHPFDKGILVCGTGQGMAMSANKHQHIRAALIYSNETASLSREHNDANVICLGSRTTDKERAINYVQTFLNTEFSTEERHKRRVNKISEGL